MSSSGYTDSGPTGGAFRTTHEEDELMSKEHKQLLREHRDKLVENMYPDDILNNLQARKILTARDVTRIKEKSNPDNMNECLLDVLMRKPDRAFSEFIEALRASDQSHVANVLDKKGIIHKDSGHVHNVKEDKDDLDLPSTSARKRKATIGVRVHASELEEDEDEDEYDDLVPKAKKRHNREEALTSKLNEEILETSLIELRNLKSIAKSGLSPQNVNARRKIMKTLRDLQRFRREIIGIEEGSVIYQIYCPSLHAVEDLWNMYGTGQLKKLFEDSFITPSTLLRFGLKAASINVHIEHQEYLACWTYLAGQGIGLCVPMSPCKDGRRSPSLGVSLSHSEPSAPMEQANSHGGNRLCKTPQNIIQVLEESSDWSSSGLNSSSGVSSCSLTPVDLEPLDPTDPALCVYSEDSRSPDPVPEDHAL